jgi:transcriptional regulator with XRE-family HTH domain
MAMAEPAPDDRLDELRGGAVGKLQANPIDKNVGTRLRVRRMTLGLSQTDIGAAIGVTFQQVQHYEKGVHRIGAGRLHQLAGILGVPVAFFFEDTSAKSAPAEDPMDDLANSASLRLAMAFTRITDRCESFASSRSSPAPNDEGAARPAAPVFPAPERVQRITGRPCHGMVLAASLFSAPFARCG